MSWFDIPDSDELSEEQKEIYGYQLSSDLLINGAAGSGKTLLAIYRAKQLEDVGQNVLFIVYTNTLREYVEMGAEEIGLENTTIATIQDLSEEAIGYRLKDFSSFDQDNCESIVQYFDGFDHVVIDEGQDFSINIYKKLFSKLGHSFTICIDRKQQIYSKHDFSKEKLFKIFTSLIEKKLDFTYRNPQNILKIALAYYREQLNTTPAETLVKSYNSNLGTVKLINTNNEIATIRRLIQDKGMDTIGILLPRRKTVVDVASYLDDYGDVQYEEYHSNGSRISFENDLAKIIPYWSSKGTQFDTIVIPFIGTKTVSTHDNVFNTDWNDEQKALYVAMTRAKEKLIFIEPSNYHFPYKESLDESLYDISQVSEDVEDDIDPTGFVINDDFF